MQLDSSKAQRACAQCGREFEVALSQLARGRGRFCTRLCANNARHITPAQFWANLSTGSGCHEWQGARDKDGYGVLGISQRQVRAHRRAYELAYGPIPDGLEVCHHCDNPPCCRPDHLFAGTSNDNVQDKISKGRFRFPTGERVGGVKLTADLVVAIRREWEQGGISQTALAAQYRVSFQNVSLIVRRKTWRHVR